MTPQPIVFIFFTVFTKKYGPKLVDFYFFTFLQEITKKEPKKILWGVAAMDLSTESNEKSKVQNSHFEKNVTQKYFV